MPHYFSQPDYNSSFTTPENTLDLPLLGRKSKLNPPNNLPPARQSAEKARLDGQNRNERVASKYSINMTKKEEHVPEFSQGSVHNYSSPASLPKAKNLLSGVLEEDTPAYSLHMKKPRASRFISASHARDYSTKVEVPIIEDITPQFDIKKPRGTRFGSATHSRDVSLKVVPVVREVPPPFDDKKVLASLKFLEKKVAALEKHRAEDEKTIQQLQLENRMSKLDSKGGKNWYRGDSAMGSTDGGSEQGHKMSSSQRKLTVEQNRLEASCRKLQNQINTMNQAASESQLNLDRITQERDSAVSQLGVAYFTIEQLKADNQNLRERNSMLKRSVDELIANQDDTTTNAKDKAFENKQRLEEPSATSLDLKAKPLRKEAPPKAEAPDKGQGAGSGSMPRRLSTVHDSGSTENLTFLSVVSAGDIRELRETLENERIARSKKRASCRQASKTEVVAKDLTADERTPQLSLTCELPITEPTQPQDLQAASIIEENTQQPTPTRKSPTIEPLRRRASKTGSLNEKTAYERRSQQLELTGKADGEEPDQHEEEPDQHEEEPDQHGEDASVMSTGSRRDDENSENVTFDWTNDDFAPDFSEYDGRPTTAPCREAEIPSEDVPSVFTGRVEQESAKLGKEPKVDFEPVPVSKKSREPAQYDEEPTLRPSQSPALALASVMKALEDELSLAKRQLAQYQSLYNNQNPALAKRARKSLKAKMESLLKTIDTKADHIYSLYDVVVGQKQHDQVMSNEKLEATLQTMGIEISWEGIRSNGETKGSCPINDRASAGLERGQ
ncbi:hypothetical protein MMC07_001588 [Pseudocyphellaria aurata]|nr:hypothetical protein [Pseudocyphellaria aurata]